MALPADFEDPHAVDRLMAAAAAEAGTLQGLVLSHAESVDSGILDASLESFDRHFAVNARASWQLIATLALQAGPDGGAILALTSDHTAHNVPYGASKGALDRVGDRGGPGARPAGHQLPTSSIRGRWILAGWIDTLRNE